LRLLAAGSTLSAMSPDDVRAARQRLELTQLQLADALRLARPYGKDVVRSWETGRRPITGPAQVAIAFMLRFGLLEADPPPS
jgi:DNA-binding transcriptional regulator YiaG